MKSKHCFNYAKPETEVFVVHVDVPMLNASISNSSSEGFQDENDFESIWN